MKFCHGCSTNKELCEFGKQTSAGDGLKTQCRQCRASYVKSYRANNHEKMKNSSKKWASENKEKVTNSFYKREYGITVSDFKNMVLSQNGKCSICNRVPKNKLCVDHDHTTGQIRGLLCRSCNGALGVFGDSLEGLKKVIDYCSRTL